MHFIKIPHKNLLRRPVRTALTCLGVALGVASFIALTGLSNGVERAWTTGLNEKGTHVLAMRRGAAEILTATLDETLAEKIAAIEGVAGVSGELIDLIQAENGKTVLLSGWPLNSSLWKTLHLVKGNSDLPISSKTVVLGESIAAALGKRHGDTLSVHERHYTVRALHKSRGTLNNNTIIMALPEMQNLTGKRGQVTVFNIQLKNPEDEGSTSRILNELHNGFPALMFQETREIADNNKILRMFRAIAWSTSLIALCICAFVVLNTLMISVTERKKEIGIYAALGWRPARIMGMIGLEALIMTSLGGAVGILMGVFGLEWITRSTELKAYVEPRLGTMLVAKTFMASSLLGALASIYPAWLAIRTNPTEALRYE